MTRTIETLKCLFPEINSVCALDILREWSGFHTCDSRENISVLTERWAKHFNDFQVVAPQEEDHLSYMHPRETALQLQHRCIQFAEYILQHNKKAQKDPNHVIIAVSHSALLRTMQAVFGIGEPENRSIKNNSWLVADIPLGWRKERALLNEMPLIDSNNIPLNISGFKSSITRVVNASGSPFDLIVYVDDSSSVFTPKALSEALFDSSNAARQMIVSLKCFGSADEEENYERLRGQLKRISFCHLPKNDMEWESFVDVKNDCFDDQIRLVNACSALIDRGHRIMESNLAEQKVDNESFHPDSATLASMGSYEVDKKQLLLGMINFLIVKEESASESVLNAVGQALRGAGALGVVLFKIKK